MARPRPSGQAVEVAKAARDGSSDDGPLLALLHAIATRDHDAVSRQLDASPALATHSIALGASRNGPDGYFLHHIAHYVYQGDTALHIAAAANDPNSAELLIEREADVRARNRRGAEPLHYAADGSPNAEWWDPNAQAQVVRLLIANGADPDAFDKSGVAPLHRAVRTRSSQAVEALIESGANPRLMNKSGSTPLHLAVQNTGRSNSGSDAAKEEQRRVIAILLAHGARPTDRDAKGKTVDAAATSDWIRELLLET